MMFFAKDNYCTGVPRATRMFPWGSAPAKRFKTTALNSLCCLEQRVTTRQQTIILRNRFLMQSNVQINTILV